MEEVDTPPSEGRSAGDRPTLSKTGRRTLEALFRHPIAHNLEWADVVALMRKIGSVEHKSNNETSLRIGAQHQLFRTPRVKDLTVDEVMELRHFLARAGWAPRTAPERPDPSISPAPDLLVAVEHHQARLYRLDLRSADPSNHVIRPYDPHNFLHHLTHKDQSRERGQRAAEDPSFYERISGALAAAGRIVVVGHGKGHSNAARHLIEWLRSHHAETSQKVVGEVEVDLSATTEAQLLDLGRRALSA
jgi:hypothetical protein